MRSSFLRAILLLPLCLAANYAASINADLSAVAILDGVNSSRTSDAGEPLHAAASPRPGLPDELVGFEARSVAVDMALFRGSPAFRPVQPGSPNGSREFQGIGDAGKYLEVEFSMFADDERFRIFAPLVVLACLAFAGFAAARRFGTR